MKKSLVILLHLGFWGCYLLLAMVIMGILYGENENVDDGQIKAAFQVILFFALIPAAITFYAFYFLVFPKVQQKKIGSAVSYGLFISFGAALVGYGFLYNTFGNNCFEKESEDSMIGVMLFMSFVALVAGIIALVIQGFVTWFEEIKLKETLKQKNQEMELALVKAQLDPHFLFNTINNIDVLILRDADKASNYLNKLSDIMRFMLYETKSDEIPLTKELEYIEKYIELQKIRTSNAKYVNFCVQGNPTDKSIAPMVFIPFIENAFKHNNNKKLEDAIDISIHIEEEGVNLQCNNKFDSNRRPNGENNGLGNDLIRKRLGLIYPDRHELAIRNENDLYSVSLSIQHG